MNAKELTIGSYYLDINIIQAEAEDINHWYYSTFMPSGIPLTGQWFIDFGFERRSFACYMKDNLVAIQNGEDTPWTISIGDQDITDVQHVHELQNLWWAIYKVELIKQS